MLLVLFFIALQLHLKDKHILRASMLLRLGLMLLLCALALLCRK